MRTWTTDNTNYIPFIPSPTKPDREDYERDLKERQRKHMEDVTRDAIPWSPCLHDSCEKCHGTGITKTGPCVHMISCPCPKCSPYCLAAT